jgi:hypothetical protein
MTNRDARFESRRECGNYLEGMPGIGESVPMWDSGKSSEYNIAATLVMLIKTGALQKKFMTHWGTFVDSQIECGNNISKQELDKEIGNMLKA